jgi:hypothetical protein
MDDAVKANHETAMKIIRETDERSLVFLVMKLSNGYCNPSTVEHMARKIKNEVTDRT